MDEALEDVDRIEWYKRPKWLASLAALIAALSFAGFVTTTVMTSNRVDTSTEKVDAAALLAEANAKSLEKIEEAIEGIQHNQEGIDELVEFVRDLQAQPPSNGTQQAVQQVITLLCASEDPVRRQACEEIGH